MKRLMFAAMLLLLANEMLGRAAAVFEGAWSAVIPGPSGQAGLAVTLVFTVRDGKAGGTVSTGDRRFALVDVKIDGDTIAFAVEGEEQNKYTGRLTGDQIAFQVKYPSHENGTRVWSFVARRAVETASGGAAQASGSAAVSVDGDWEGAVPRGGGRVIDARFTLHADGGVLTGSVHAVGDDFPVEKGHVSGGSISFKIGSTQGEYTGIVSGDEIQMKVKYDGGEAGRQTLSFVLHRVTRESIAVARPFITAASSPLR